MTRSSPEVGRSKPASSISIEYLADRTEFIPTLARWHYDEWSAVRPGDSVESRIARLTGSTGRAQIPLTVIALAEGRLLGSASLIEHDMDDRPELSPWLSGVFVAPEHRRQGIGAALVRRVMDEAISLQVSKLYLYTFKSASFYAELGWSLMEAATYRGKEVMIMSYSSPIVRP